MRRSIIGLALAAATFPAGTALRVDDDAELQDAASPRRKYSKQDASAIDPDVWTETTNIYRCMHESPPVKWCEDLAKQAMEWMGQFPPVMASSSYNLDPPQGENLASNTEGKKDIKGRIADWYSERKFCDTLPGCEHSTKLNSSTGHFTALVWKGVKKIGCASGRKDDIWYYVCRYASGPALSEDTPNMAGAYIKNVGQQKMGMVDCDRCVKAGNCPVETPTPTPAPPPLPGVNISGGTNACANLPSPLSKDDQTWLDETNKYRCMHSAQKLTWSAELARQTQEWVNRMPPVQSGQTYSSSPPSAENIGSSGKNDIAGYVKQWHDEYKSCILFPGCEQKMEGEIVRHFTAMVWKAAKEMGCARRKASDGNWYYVCRYADGKRELSDDTVNLKGGFVKNVDDIVNSTQLEKCKNDCITALQPGSTEPGFSSAGAPAPSG